MDTGAESGPWTRVPLDRPTEVEVSPFLVKVNGINVFLKGFNWQNPEVLFGCESVEKVEQLLNYALYANANALRLWGGATVEIDEFYKLCSKKGLLVWQDFYYACAIYPTDHPQFQQTVAAEAADMILRLRNHTCLAMWCGDNESDMIYFDKGIDPASNVVNKVVLPRVLLEHDIQRRYYHPSSPSGGPYPRSDWGGDKRNWGACSPYGNYRHIRQENARLMSEGGYYVLPHMDSIRKFMPRTMEWPLNNATWALHSGSVDTTLSARRFLEGMEACVRYFDTIDSLEKAVEVSQFAHAWGTKLIAERCRQRKFDCGGVLLWKLAASWPCADGMVVDYYLRALLSLEYMREAYKMVNVSITQDFADSHADAEVYVSNDLLREMKGTLEIFTTEVDEEGKMDKFCRLELMDLVIEANSSKPVRRIRTVGLNVENFVIGAVLRLEGYAEYAVGLFTLEPRAAYRALKAHRYDQQLLCRNIV
jgi:beta-mannosidase